MAVTKVRASHILVKDELTANAVIDLLRDGASFPQLAKQYSSCPSKRNGGDLGWFGRGQMVKPFEAAAFNATPGEIVKCKTEFGWHVILVTEQR
jgi:peptidyl-prolyl cis-trans isomerase C